MIQVRLKWQIDYKEPTKVGSRINNGRQYLVRWLTMANLEPKMALCCGCGRSDMCCHPHLEQFNHSTPVPPSPLPHPLCPIKKFYWRTHTIFAILSYPFDCAIILYNIIWPNNFTHQGMFSYVRVQYYTNIYKVILTVAIFLLSTGDQHYIP